MPLTELQIKKAKPQPGKSVRLFDARELYLEVSETGEKWWRLKYRNAREGEAIIPRRLPGDRFERARDHCDEARRLLSDGVDRSLQCQIVKLAREDPLMSS